MSQIVDGLINLPPWLVLMVAFLLPAAEASIFVGVIFPGEIAVVIAGVLAHSHRLPLWLVIVVGTAGAVLGDSIGYEVGARYGDRLLAKLPHRLVKPEHVDRGRELLRRRGGWAVLFGRFAAALRALVPGLAGTSRLPYRTFLPFNVVGGVAWVTMSALVGYVAGASYQAAEHRLSLVSGGLLALVVLAVAYRYLRMRLSRRRSAEPAKGPDPAAEPVPTTEPGGAAEPGSIDGPPPAPGVTSPLTRSHG
jgi:undecaprenyl-diphosphatase